MGTGRSTDTKPGAVGAGQQGPISTGATARSCQAGSGTQQQSHWVLRCPRLSSFHPRARALCSLQHSGCAAGRLHTAFPRTSQIIQGCITQNMTSPLPWMAESRLRICVYRDSKCSHFSMMLFFTKTQFSDFEDFFRISRSEESCQLLSDCFTHRNPTQTHSRATVALQNSNFEQHCIYQTCTRTVAVQLHHQQNLLDGQNAYAMNSWSVTHSNAKAGKKHWIYYSCALGLLVKRSTMK